MIKNNELETMIKIENVIGMFEKQIFGENKDKEVKIKWFDNSETIVTADDFVDYINLVEKIIVEKKILTNRANEYNKKNKEYHKISNSICKARKSGNVEKLEYWQNKLDEYKKNKKSL